MLSENGDVIKIDTTGRQAASPLDRDYPKWRTDVDFAPVSQAAILKCACVEFIEHAH